MVREQQPAAVRDPAEDVGRLGPAPAKPVPSSLSSRGRSVSTFSAQVTTAISPETTTRTSVMKN